VPESSSQIAVVSLNESLVGYRHRELKLARSETSEHDDSGKCLYHISVGFRVKSHIAQKLLNLSEKYVFLNDDRAHLC
jgi:hypothetical protein